MSQQEFYDAEEFEESDGPVELEKPPAWIHVLCGWPLVMIAFGGAIGGGLGGAAYGLSLTVYRKTRSIPLTVVASVAFGGGAFFTWLFVAGRLAEHAV